MPPLEKLLALICTASLGLNAYLLLRAPSSPEQQQATQSGAPAPRSGGAAPAPSLSVARAEACREHLQLCATQRNQLESEVAKYLPMSERFTRGNSNLPLEETLRELIPADLAEAGVPLDIECRADVCQLEVLASRSTDMDAVNNWVNGGLSAAFGRKAFQSPVPTSDPVTGEPLRKYTYQLGAKDRAAGDGDALLDEILGGFKAAGAVAACAASAPSDTGVLSLRLDLGIAGSGGGFVVHAGGELAATEAGRCIVERLEVAGATVALPPAINGAVRYLTIELPLS